jgi:DNA-binding response OmpR family regulator
MTQDSITAVVLIEDLEDLGRQYCRWLRHHNFEVIYFVAGRPALVYLEDHQPDLIIVDIELPDMNGVEVVREARKQGYMGPIIAISGFDLNTEELRNVGFAARLHKPFPLNELSDAAKAATVGCDINIP